MVDWLKRSKIYKVLNFATLVFCFFYFFFDFVRTFQILKSLGNLHEVVAHKAVNNKLLEVCQISAPYFNAITNTKN